MFLILLCTAMNRVSEKRKAYRDRTGIFFQYLNGQFHECFLIGNFQFLFPTFILVISLYGKICQRKLLSGSVTDHSNHFHSTEIQVLPKVKLCPVITSQLQGIYINTQAFCRDQFFLVCPQWIIRPVISGLPSAAFHLRAAGGFFFCIDISGSACRLMGQTVGINVSYKTDPFICPAVFCIIIVGDVINPVQAVIKTNDTSYICCVCLCCLYLSCKGIVLKGISAVIPGLCHIEVSTKDSSHLVRTGDASLCTATVDSNLASVRGCRIVITATCNTTSHFTGSLYGAIKFTADHRTVSHGIVPGSDNTAYITASVNGGITYTVFHGPLHTTGNSTDFIHIFVISNDNILFNGTIPYCCFKGRRTSGIRTHGLIRTQKSCFQSAGSAL